MTLQNLLAVARGDSPADLLLQNGRILNVYSGRIEKASIAICGEFIAGIWAEQESQADGWHYDSHKTVDLDGAYVAPGLIDAHVHIESSLCTPPQFARAILPRGVTCVVTDPHEIANVAGVEGVRFMIDSSQGGSLSVITMAPSCVPASHMETNGANLDDEDLIPLLRDGAVHGLAELMNFPGVINGAPDVLAKLNAFQSRPLDGHAPGLRGAALNAYAASGIGSEHECTTVEEAAEKLARGFYILIREATNARNLHTLLPLITPENSRRICFCTDDRIPGDLLDQGSIDYMVREAIHYGIDPMTAFRMATLNSAEWFGLYQHGGVAPGRYANLMIFDDLAEPAAKLVYARGKEVAVEGKLTDDARLPSIGTTIHVSDTVQVNLQGIDLTVPVSDRRAADRPKIRVIGAIEDQLLTEERLLDPHVVDGEVVADPARDLLKMAVVERHTPKNSNRPNPVGLGFIQGFGLKRGAIAGTVAHDHHNLVVIGADDESMRLAIDHVAAQGGGLAVVDGGKVLASLALPIAGLMSDQPIEQVRETYDKARAAAHELGSSIHDPFMAMSFMALEVIPRLKLTDKGLVDVDRFELVDLFVDSL